MTGRAWWLCGIVGLIAGVASAELSDSYRAWPDGPVKFLLTRTERKAYDKLTTDAEAQRFIDLFWAKRDPDLGTGVNEFKVEFDARVATADRQFSYSNVAGSMTDRGKTLILLGPPSAASQLTADPGPGAVEGRSQIDKSVPQVWMYSKGRLPKWARQDDTLFYFLESRRGIGDFLLPPGDLRNGAAIRLVNGAAEHLILHPDLKEVPKPGVLGGSVPATQQQLAVLDAAPRPWPEGAIALAVSGVQSAEVHALWVWVQLPATAPLADRAVGRVAPADGSAEIGTFSAPVSPLEIAGGRAYRFAFPVGAGVFKVDLALLAGTTPVAVTTVGGTIEPVPAEGTYLSPVFAGVDVQQQPAAGQGEPFVVGGWQVTPRPSHLYSPKETLSYFCFVSRPGLDETEAAQAELSVAIFKGDKKIAESAAQPVKPSHIAGDLWMIGSQLPLYSTRRGGDYRLEITVKDARSGVTRTSSIPVTAVVAPAEAAPPPAS